MAMNNERYRAGEVISFKEEQANCFYIVKSGKVAMEKNNKVMAFYYSGNFFGEDALYMSFIPI